MKFSVSQSSLNLALSIVGKGLATNSTIPILSGIYLKAADGTIELQTTDLNISIRHKIPANVEEPGITVVSGKLLTNIVKTLPDAAVTFESTPHNIAIHCERSSFKLTTLEAEDFPEFPSLALDRSIELPSKTLSQMISKVYRVTSKDNSRPILQGIQLTVENNTMRLVATDSYRLAVCDTHTDTDSKEPFSVIVPGGTFHEVLSLPSMTEKILIGTTDSQVAFVFNNTTFISRRVEGNFPNYRQLLSSNCKTSVKFEAGLLAPALKRVSVIAAANPAVKFIINVNDATMTLEAFAPDQGASSETLSVEVEGEDITIALNHRYVADCLAAVSDTDKLTLELEGPMRPGVFKSYGDINYLYLLMPVRL
ncbi:MAG: DNA polymerase III subunit beta [Olegusella sp.]|jgi:DNA polymerase-3 subunit beta|nr:DNA polymerase III subunit beta [Olegusella sp.]MCI1933644.1 DNA polymerase III subunit beta [Atopobiaceae bacterium]